MRIAGSVSKAERLELDYIKSVHLVSRWVHEMFEAPGPELDGQGGTVGNETVATRRR